MNNLTIRPLSLADAPKLYRIIERNREHIAQFFPKTLKAITDLKGAQEYIELRVAQTIRREYFFFVIESEGLPVGCVTLRDIDWSVPRGDVAFFVDADHQGRGITTDAMAWLVRYCFDELHLEKISARLSASNEASRQVVLKNKFVLEGTLRKEFRDGHGNLADIEYYGLCKG